MVVTTRIKAPGSLRCWMGGSIRKESVACGGYSGEGGSTWIGPIEKDPWTHGGKYGSGRKLPSCQLNREFRLGEITKNMQIFVLKIIILL